ncbi:MAG: iron ABC transporter permease [Clostridiales Family XIII bacterium]|jgi:iron complex transport system permease protein|nr:iron ABC transporter permease [Clostridiales Family XIII bacterium]
MLNRKFVFTYTLMLVLLFLSFLLSLTYSLNGISFFEAVNALFNVGDANIIIIIKDIRLTRVIIVCVTGAVLGASGCVFQAILRNPLADPFTLGISGGAALGTCVTFISGLAAAASLFVPLFSFVGAILSVFIVYAFGFKGKFNSNNIILSGVVVSYAFSSLVMLMLVLSQFTNVQQSLMWLMGNFSTFDERLMPAITIISVVGLIILSLYGNTIDAISLGHEKFKTLGSNIKNNIKIMFLITSLIVAAIVSICGVIGFVGLIIPHIMRIFVGPKATFLIPASAIGGALFLLLCDTISKILFLPVVIPPGIITSILGGVFFVFLLLNQKRV